MAACRPIEPNELRLLRESMNSHRNSLWLALGVLSGFRISELLSVKVSDVIDPDGTCKQFLTVQRKHMKGSTKSRSVELGNISALVYPWLEVMEIWGFVQMNNPLFIAADGKVIGRKRAYNIITHHAKKCGIKPNELGVIGTHSMRKTFARNVHKMNLVEDPGNALMMTRDALGHKSVASTKKYLRSCFCSVAARNAIRQHIAETIDIFVKPAPTKPADHLKPLEAINGN